jgi:hypothetical protein
LRAVTEVPDEVIVALQNDVTLCPLPYVQVTVHVLGRRLVDLGA